MDAAQVTVRTRRLMRNPLLARRQFVVDVLHLGRPPVSKDKLREQIAKLHKVDVALVVVFGMSVNYGGGRSTGFGMIYDNKEALLKFEPRHRLQRLKLVDKKSRSRKMYKDAKMKKNKTWGTGRREAARMAKKAANS